MREHATGDGFAVARQAGCQPPHRYFVPGGGRGKVVGGEQALGRVNDGSVGEPGNGGRGDLGCGPGEVQAAADAGLRLAQPAGLGLRPGTLDDHQNGVARPGHRLPADREPALA